MEMDLFYDGWCPYCNYASVLVWPNGTCRCVGCGREWYEERFDYRTVAEIYAEQEAQQRKKYRPTFTPNHPPIKSDKPVEVGDVLMWIIGILVLSAIGGIILMIIYFFGFSFFHDCGKFICSHEPDISWSSYFICVGICALPLSLIALMSDFK